MVTAARDLSSVLLMDKPAAMARDSLDLVVDAFGKGFTAMKLHGLDLWEYHSLDSGETKLGLYDQILELAVTAIHSEDAKQLFEGLISNEGHGLFTQLVKLPQMDDDPDELRVIDGSNRLLQSLVSALGQHGAGMPKKLADDIAETLVSSVVSSA